MKYLITTLSLFVSFIVSSQELNYQILNNKAQHFLDSLGIVYIPLDIRAGDTPFVIEITDDVKNDFLITHPSLEYVPNQDTEKLPSCDEFIDMFGGETEIIGGVFEISTPHDKIIGFSDFQINENQMVRIIEIKKVVIENGITLYFFDSMVFVLDKYIGWYKVTE